LGPDYDIDTHFTPSYRPWRQRVALVPDGDFFKSIKAGQVSVLTDEIETFTETGVRLKSGTVLEADIVVTATGFNMNVLGDIEFSIDDEPLVFSDTVNYRGMMFTGVPNLLWVFGYFRGSWTVRADLLSDFVCRLLTHMDGKSAKRVEVKLRPEDEDMELLPWQDPENFNPGYLTRAMPLLPRSGDKPEWHHSQNLSEDLKTIPSIDLDGDEFAWG
jgi:cation diffusion facilitator CzcD-associated flavoprotein CzcO